MNLLLPCAGRSSRYPTERPKYLLPVPDGRTMLEMVAAPFVDAAERVIVCLLREHDEAFAAADVVRAAVPQAEILVLPEVTRGQAHTVAEMIRRADVSGEILVKDSDSYFLPTAEYRAGHNFVSVCDARETPGVALHNKGFVIVNQQGYIVGTAEKQIVSSLFSCGGYFFADAARFLQAFERLKTRPGGHEMYLSQVIDFMIDAGEFFEPLRCSDYVDLGTFREWAAYRRRYRTYFIPLEGGVFDADVETSQWREPSAGELQAVRTGLQRLQSEGHSLVLYTMRPDRERAEILARLKSLELPFDQLLCGVFDAPAVWVERVDRVRQAPQSEHVQLVDRQLFWNSVAPSLEATS